VRYDASSGFQTRSAAAIGSRSSWARAWRYSGVLLVMLLLLAWEASVRGGWIVSANWPALSSVLDALVDGFRTGEWYAVFGISLYRMAAGYSVGCAIAVTVGVCLALSIHARRVLLPAIELLRPIPIPALIPPLVFLLGVDDALKIFIIAFAAFFPVFTNTVAGVHAVDPVHLQVARTFQVPRWRSALRIQVPSALPYILAGMRVSLGLALIVTVVAEMIAGSDGVGYFVVSMQYAMRAGDMYAAVILLSALGYLLNRGFLGAEATLIRWARQHEHRSGE